MHSDAPDQALEQLDRPDEPGSPYRIVVSVGMLKEGWDVKNVYVIASLRASVSEILTEQTLGRGMRLSFGQYTGVELLDTLVVLGHERYEELLRKAGVLNEQFIDWRSRAALHRRPDGSVEVRTVREPAQFGLFAVDGERPETAPLPLAFAPSPLPVSAPRISGLDTVIRGGEQALATLHVQLPPRNDAPPLLIPQLKMTAVRSEFSLADITDLAPFRRLGETLASDPAGTLRRMTVTARIVEGADGIRRTELVPTRAADRVESPASLFPLDDLRRQLIDRVLNAPVVPARANQRRPAAEIVDSLLAGLGLSAERILSGYLDRAAARLI